MHRCSGSAPDELNQTRGHWSAESPLEVFLMQPRLNALIWSGSGVTGPFLSRIDLTVPHISEADFQFPFFFF